jgi:amphi-Trp domain-containing protein
MGKDEDGKAKASFSMANRFELRKVVDFFQDLVDSLEQGQVVLEQPNGEQVDLQPTSVVDMEVQAEQKGKKEELAIRVKWERGKLENPVEVISTRRKAEPAASSSGSSSQSKSKSKSKGKKGK